MLRFVMLPIRKEVDVWVNPALVTHVLPASTPKGDVESYVCFGDPSNHIQVAMTPTDVVNALVGN